MRLFHPFAGLALACLALTGCVPVISNPIHQNAVYGGVAAYGIAQKGIVAYGKLPYCAVGTTTTLTNYCQDPAVEVKLQKANADVKLARKALESFVRNPANYPGLTYAGLYQAWQTAKTALSLIAANNGVQ